MGVKSQGVLPFQRNDGLGPRGMMSGDMMKGYGGKMVRRFLFILLFFLPTVAYALQHTAEGILDYTLEVSFDIEASKIKGIATIPVKKGQEIKLGKGRLNLIYVSLDKQRIDISYRDEIVRILSSREGKIEIQYEGMFRSQDTEETSSVIGSRGIFLTGTWYPKPDQMCYYHLTVALPDEYEAVSEAESVEKTLKDGRKIFAFNFPHPLDAINLVATDRYKIVRDHFNDVEIFAYFFPEDGYLIQTYIEHSKKFLELYENLISKFPYKRFSIVENFLPTGYSMPTYAVLGQEVLRLPFIPETSLGHEILHQWFGNSVYIDYQMGNWAEGLTTYLADHLYEEKKGRGFEYRKGTLIDYQSYVNDKNEFPLKDFTERTDYASKAIGYGKALMVFQMLKKLVGEERFYESIRHLATEMRFKKASWDDIQRAFEKYYQKDLTWFFNQWIDEKGLAELYLEDLRVEPLGAKFQVTFTIIQKNKVYILDLPVALHSYGSNAKNLFHLQKGKERLKMLIDDIPERMVIDEDYDVARRLSMAEFPPVISRLIGDEKPIIVPSPSGAEIYDEVIRTFKEKGASVSQPDHIKYTDLRTSSLVILGAENPLVKRLYGSLTTQTGFSLLIKENPWDPSKVAGIFDAQSKEEVNGAFQKIFHYGKYSALSFDRGVNVYKKIDETVRGIMKEVCRQAVTVDVATLKDLPYVMEHIAGKMIIYVGETHDQFSHHAMQLEIIKDLYRRGRKVAIGMEMFQRPFQKALDDYIEGRTDEREFLKTTQYFERWGFDYNLYRPILQFARAENIPVVALNMRQEIVDKVFRGGFDSLSPEEKESLPSQMDFSDNAYKERLRKIFGEHEDYKTEKFDFFYQAQILWDETMSESIDRFLRTHPNDQMVVLAGSGHLTYGFGIPKRTARRNGYDYAIILNDVDVEKDVADFILFPGTIPGVTSPKLMVLLTEKGGKVEIAGFAHGSNSEKAGMKAGDIILSVDHTPIHQVDDVKIELLFKKKGDKVKVGTLRKTFWGIPKEMNFEVALQ
jgi:aminopeptidase N